MRYTSQRLRDKNIHHNCDLETLGQRVTRLRTELKLTQEQLAAKAGIAQSTLNGVEKGARQKAPSSLIEIAHALSVDAFWLKTGRGNSKQIETPGAMQDMAVYHFKQQDDPVTLEIIDIARRLDAVGKGMLLAKARDFAEERAKSTKANTA